MIPQTNTTYDTVESIAVIDDDDKFPTLQFLNQNGEVIATYNGPDFTAYKNIKTKKSIFKTAIFFVYNDETGEGKNIYISKEGEGKYYILPLSDNLYNQIMEKLPKEKAHIEAKDYYFTMRDIAKKQETKDNQNTNKEQIKENNKEMTVNEKEEVVQSDVTDIQKDVLPKDECVKQQKNDKNIATSFWPYLNQIYQQTRGLIRHP